MSERKWNYDGDFLEQFPANHKGVVANVFCGRVREGCRTVDEVIKAARAFAAERLLRPNSWETEGALEAMATLKQSLGDGEGRDFAEHILWRESLPFAERKRLKEEAQAEGARTYSQFRMAKLDPTEKQLAYLKTLGCKIIPQTRLEASELIERHLRGDVQKQSAETPSCAA